jgi:carotenoid cleavage dioxygenase-like enzyme
LPAWATTPDNWQIGFETAPDARDSELALLSGRLPSDLEGVLYRVGPGQFERAGERLGHWFDGDGMIQRFSIGQGRVRHSGRFVQTDKRKMEEAAGRFLYFGYGFAPKNPGTIHRPNDLNAANTNVLGFGKEVWALWEGGSPWRVNGQDLATIGRRAFDGKFDGLPFSAHPKRGPDGDVWNFGALGGKCVIWHLDREGSPKNVALVDLPVASLMHDFAVTHTKIILLLPPLILSDHAGRSLIDRYSWRAAEPLRILVLDKDDLSKRRIFELPARFLFHIGNAWEDRSGTLRLDAFLFDDSTFASQGTRDLPLGKYVEPPSARPTLITLHPDGRAAMASHDGTGEFPRIDPRLIGLEHRHTYGVIGFGIGHWDWRSGRRSTYSYGANHWSEEPIFVPRPSRASEQDGWIIATSLNSASRRTELSVFDARGIEDGPIAQFACPYALPLGFHGTFASAS